MKKHWLDTPGHEFQQADWVCLNDWGTAPLQPKWKGPFQALLTTFTALKLHKVKFWIPCSRIKRLSQSSGWRNKFGDQEHVKQWRWRS
uniref:Murine leukemia virus integrase C-terminal domain-containing protein n=1 Tax=Junco hyemalis TaxID=40217 RepID=A0A8C5NN41_JUNHY